mgnify:CR=1 FL=1
MSSLANCLKKMKLSKHESAILRGMAIENEDSGMEEQEAAIKAVRDYLASSLGLRAGFVQAIKDAGGDVESFTEKQSAHENEIVDILAEAEKAKADIEAQKEAERNRQTAIADQEKAALAKVKESADGLANLQKSVAESLKAAAAALAPAENVDTAAQPEAAPTDQQQAQQDDYFDSEAFDKKRNDTIKASRDAGNIHLDKVDAAVETMRGREIFYVHNAKQRGVVRTVDNNGNVYVQWSDEYSAQKEIPE